LKQVLRHHGLPSTAHQIPDVTVILCADDALFVHAVDRSQTQSLFATHPDLRHLDAILDHYYRADDQ
jgi:hypothetical protein